MAEWSFFDLDYSNWTYDACEPYDADKYTCYQDMNIPPAPAPAPAQCLPVQEQTYPCPSPVVAIPLSSVQQFRQVEQETQQPCDYNPAPAMENPRELRNKAEKQRRDKMNESIARLASIVPPVAKPGKKVNKRNVLRLAAHYLRSHQHVFGNSIDRGPEFSATFTQALMKSFKGFLITTTYKGIVVVVSPNIQEYLGYNEVDLLGQNILNIIHKDDRRLLLEQLFPKSCSLTPKGQLLLSQEWGSQEKIAEALSKEKRSFIVRFKRFNQVHSEPAKYVTCHVEGALRKSDNAGVFSDNIIPMGRRARSRGANPFASGNDIVFVGMVRPTTETFLSESGIESFRMEYRTRHFIDGEIIQCEQRIALVTGYMTHEVKGVNAMNFMHRDDVRWVIIALREMYDQHRLVGESCYRLLTKNGKFIYMRTLGHLDVNEDSKAVRSFVCTNTVVEEKEGKHLIDLMKKKFTLMINNGVPQNFEEELQTHEEDESQNPPIEDPRQLEKVILHLVTNLPSPAPDGTDNASGPGNGEQLTTHLTIIPPHRERIQKAIEKSSTIIKRIDVTSKSVENKDNTSVSTTEEPNATVTSQPEATEFNQSAIIDSLFEDIINKEPQENYADIEFPQYLQIEDFE